MELRSRKNQVGERVLRSGAPQAARKVPRGKPKPAPAQKVSVPKSRAERAAARNDRVPQMVNVPPVQPEPAIRRSASKPEVIAPAPVIRRGDSKTEVIEPEPVMRRGDSKMEVIEPEPVVGKRSSSKVDIAVEKVPSPVRPVQAEAPLAPEVAQKLLQQLDGTQAKHAMKTTGGRGGNPKKTGRQAPAKPGNQPAKPKTGGPNGIPKRRPEVDRKNIVNTERDRKKRFKLDKRLPHTNKNSRRAMLLRGVRIAQRNSSEDVFYKAPFRYLIIQIAQAHNKGDVRYTAESVKVLQEILEFEVIRLLEIAQMASSHARPGRGVADSKPKVLRSDIEFSYRMKFGNHFGDTGLDLVKVY